MLVGVCCECQQGGKPLRYHRSGAVLDVHDAFGSPCKGEGSAPQATYEWSDPAGSDQMPEGVQIVIGNGLLIVKDRIQEDQFEREEQEREQAKEDEKNVCCFDSWCNHRPDPPKPPGVFGTIGDIVLAAKNSKQKTKKKG